MLDLILNSLVMYFLCVMVVAIDIYTFFSKETETPRLICVISGGLFMWICGKYIVGLGV